jgi:AcrR family transcriptional regulator
VSPRTGRRPGGPATRDSILSAARTAFASAGYDATSLRSIARDARVDPALVVHYFDSKAQLFAAVMELPDVLVTELAALVAGEVEGLGERVARFFLALWEAPTTRGPLLALLRSAVSHEQAAAALRGFVGDALLGQLAPRLDAPDGRLRVTLVGSQLIGVATLRYVVCIEPLASADLETLVVWLAPTLQRYLTGDVMAGAAAGR